MSVGQSNLRVVGPASMRPPGEAFDFDMLFERYSAYVAGVAARLLGRDDHEIDDVVQDVFCIAARRIHTIHNLDATKPWFIAVTVRVARKRLWKRRFRRLFQSVPEAYEVPTTDATPEQVALLRRVYRLLDTLSAPDRLAWTLRHVEG